MAEQQHPDYDNQIFTIDGMDASVRSDKPSPKVEDLLVETDPIIQKWLPKAEKDKLTLESIEADLENQQPKQQQQKYYLDNNDENNNNEDDEEGYVHDQLPSVEEVKTNRHYLLERAASNRRKCASNMSLSLTLLGLFIAVMVLIAKTNNIVTTPKSDKFITLSGRAEETIRILFDYDVSTLPSLKDGRTAQHHAAIFVADGDNYWNPTIFFDLLNVTSFP